MKSRGHVHYFDYLRVFATVCVIFMHAAAGRLRGELDADWHGLNVLTALAFTAVPLFLMMSGYLVLTDPRTGDVTLLLKKRLPRLVLPLASWSAVAAAVKLLEEGAFTFRALADRMIMALNTPQAAHLWYMYTLIALYVMAPVLYGGLKNLDRKGHILVLSLCLAVSLRAMAVAVLPSNLGRFFRIDLIDKLQIFSGHLCTYILGYYLGKMEKKIPNWALLAAALGLLAAVAAGTYSMTVRTGAFNQMFQSQSAGFEVLLAGCLFLLAKQNLDRKSRLLEKVPLVPLSLGVYLMHNILLSMIHYAGYPAGSFLQCLILTAVVLTVCCLTVKTVATVKPLCYIFTGMPYSTACRTCNWVFTFRRGKPAEALYSPAAPEGG